MVVYKLLFEASWLDRMCAHKLAHILAINVHTLRRPANTPTTRIVYPKYVFCVELTHSDVVSMYTLEQPITVGAIGANNLPDIPQFSN